MEARRPNGDVIYSTGTIEELNARAKIEKEDFNSTVKIYGPGESFISDLGQKVTVTETGLKFENMKKRKQKIKKRNKIARNSRRKNRSK